MFDFALTLHDSVSRLWRFAYVESVMLWIFTACRLHLHSCSVLQFEVGGTVADIQRRPERGRRHSNRGREEARAEGTHLHKERLQKKGPGQRKVTLKQRLEERREIHSHDTRRGT